MVRRRAFPSKYYTGTPYADDDERRADQFGVVVPQIAHITA
jgi:hypothetical protein